MQHIKLITMLAISMILLASCEEVIQLNLDTAEQQVVVEANLNVGSGTCAVKLSKSGGFYETNVFPVVTGAMVQLTTNGGAPIDISEQEAGQYLNNAIDLFPGDVVQLTVTLPDNQVIISNEVVVPNPVVLDTLLVEKMAAAGPGGPGGGGNNEDRYSLTAAWWDNAGTASYYRLKIFENQQALSGLYILADDRLGDGEYISRPVIRQTFSLGDTLRCQLLTVNKGYYDYFTDLANSDGRGFSSPAPFNPKGNLGNEVLGYFGVWYVSEKTIVAQ